MNYQFNEWNHGERESWFEKRRKNFNQCWSLGIFWTLKLNKDLQTQVSGIIWSWGFSREVGPQSTRVSPWGPGTFLTGFLHSHHFPHTVSESLFLTCWITDMFTHGFLYKFLCSCNKPSPRLHCYSPQIPSWAPGSESFGGSGLFLWWGLSSSMWFLGPFNI